MSETGEGHCCSEACVVFDIHGETGDPDFVPFDREHAPAIFEIADLRTELEAVRAEIETVRAAKERAIGRVERAERELAQAQADNRRLVALFDKQSHENATQGAKDATELAQAQARVNELEAEVRALHGE